FPVFFVLYRVLRGLTEKDSHGFFNPRYLDHGSKLYESLRHSKTMTSWGMDLSRSLWDTLHQKGFVSAIPFLILVVLVGVTSWYQQRQISGRTPQQQGDANAQMQAV